MEANDAKTIAWDPSFIKEYMKTIPGRLKLGAIITSFVVSMCVAFSGVSNTPSAHWANVVTWFGILITVTLLFCHLLRVTEVYNSIIPWRWVELGFACLWAFLFLTVSIDLAIKANNFEVMCKSDHKYCGEDGSSKVWYFRAKSFAPATFFGLIAMAIYGSEAWIIFKQWQVEQYMKEAENSDPFGDNASGPAKVGGQGGQPPPQYDDDQYDDY